MPDLHVLSSVLISTAYRELQISLRRYFGTVLPDEGARFHLNISSVGPTQQTLESSIPITLALVGSNRNRLIIIVGSKLSLVNPFCAGNVTKVTAFTFLST